MSADNYYVIKRHPSGGYAACMGFASDDEEPTVHPAQNSFPTPMEALIWANEQYSEYGASLDAEVTAEFEANKNSCQCSICETKAQDCQPVCSKCRRYIP